MQTLQNNTHDEMSYWLALLKAPKMGPVTFQKLYDIFPNFADLFAVGWQELIDCGVTPTLAAYLNNPNWKAVEQDLAWAKDPKNTILTWQNPAYPKFLREIPSAPPVLYVCGNLETLVTPQLAMVGSRNPSPSGKEIAYQFARHFATSGLTITSGLAIGIDGAAHRGALAEKGLTIAVMGTGLGRIYPARHHELAQQIVAEGGALVSEFPPDTLPKAENFPRRNRLISGLSLGVLVVEAAPQSGSLITARYALEQGREVFAIPGSIHNPLAKGCHLLLRQGAKLVETASDVLEELGSLLQAARTKTPAPNPPMEIKNLDRAYIKLVECIGFEMTPMDTIIERSDFTVETASSMLMILELQGYITAVPGGYSRI